MFITCSDWQLKDVAQKRQPFKICVNGNLMPEMQNKQTNKQKQKIGGHHDCFRDTVSCMVDHTKLPNLVIVAVVRFNYFWRKMKAFQPLEGRCCATIQLHCNF